MNSIHNGDNKDYSRYHDIEVYTIRCRQCGRLIKGEHNFHTNEVDTYEIDNYPNQKVEHEHPADNVTRIDLMHRTAVEIRYLRAPNKDDYRYLIENKRVSYY